MKQTMTIHQGLCELKIINNRIQDSLREYVITPNRNNNEKIDGMTIEEVKSTLKGNFDRTQSLLARKNAIKGAIVQSNAMTMITVGGVKMSVAQAIYENDEGYELKQNVLNNYKNQYASATNKVAVENGDKLDKKVENFLLSTFGSNEKGVKTDEMMKAEEIYRKNNSYDLIDPNKLKETIDKMEQELDSFKADIDSALQISNATTTIEIDV